MSTPTLPDANVNISHAARSPLIAAAIASLLASTCCLGPLVLLTLGISGAWIGQLTELEPFQPLFMAVVALALFLAGRRIWRPVAACKPSEVCALPSVNRAYKVVFVVTALLAMLAFGFPYFARWFY